MKVLELKSDDFVVGVANLRNILNQKDVTNVTREHQHRLCGIARAKFRNNIAASFYKLWKQDIYLEIRYLRKIPAFLGRLWSAKWLHHTRVRLKLRALNEFRWRHLENSSDRLFNVLVLSDFIKQIFSFRQRLQDLAPAV